MTKALWTLSAVLGLACPALIAACYATPLWAPKLGWRPDPHSGWEVIVVLTVCVCGLCLVGAVMCALAALDHKAREARAVREIK